jgi:NADH-quinone oxidoreductase subunit L
VLSIASGYLLSPFSPDAPNFETWTATEFVEDATYPFIEEGDHGGEEVALGVTGDGILASGTDTTLAAEGDGPFTVLHGVPYWHFDLLAIVLVLFGLAVALAYRFYGKGVPERDPTMQLGPVTKALVNKYGFDAFGYRYIVVPVRDKMSPAASRFSNEGIDKVVAGAGVAVKRAAGTTYRVLDQRVIDGGINGAAFSAAWWSDRLKRIQSGDVQRYAAALVAGVVILVVVFAAGR